MVLVRTSIVARRLDPSCTMEVPSHVRNVLSMSTADIVAVAEDVDAAIEIVPRLIDLIGDDEKELIVAPILLLRQCIPRYSNLG